MVTLTQFSIRITSFQVFDMLRTILQQEGIKFETKVDQEGNWIVQVLTINLMQVKRAVDKALSSLTQLKDVLDNQ